MKKLLKFLGISFGLLVLVVVLGSTALFFFFPKEKFEAWLKSEAKKSGVILAYKDVNMTWGVPSALVLSQLSFKMPKSKLAGDAQKVKISVDLWESIKTFSLRAKIGLTQLNLDHPKVLLKQSDMVVTLSDVLLYAKEGKSKEGKIIIIGHAKKIIVKGAKPMTIDAPKLSLVTKTDLKSVKTYTFVLKDGDGKFSATKMTQDGKVRDLTPFPLKVTFNAAQFSPTDIKLTGLKMALLDGRLAMPASKYDIRKRVETIDSFRYDHGSINDLVGLASPKHIDTLDGKLGISVNGFRQAFNKSNKPLPTSLRAKGRVQIDDVILKKRSIQTKIDGIVNSAMSKIKPLLGGQHNDAEFTVPNFQKNASKGHVDFAAVGQTVNVSEIKILNAGGEVNGSGKLFLAPKTMNMNLEITLYGVKQESAGALLDIIGNEKGDLIIPIVLKGSFDNPKYTINFGVFLKNIQAKLFKGGVNPASLMKGGEGLMKGGTKGITDAVKGGTSSIQGLMKGKGSTTGGASKSNPVEGLKGLFK